MPKEISKEAAAFDAAMDRLLKVPPQVVKAAMDADKKQRAEERKAKRASSARASRAKD